MEEYNDNPETEPVSPPKPPLSRTPSWLLLGFIVGALFVWLLQKEEKPAEPPALARPAVKAPAPAPKLDLNKIDAVFASWGEHAVWDHDITQVALWDSETGEFSQYYEVTRANGNYYFRPLDRLTWPILTHGEDLPDSPLRFTETAEMRRTWLREKAQENWTILRDAMTKRPENEPARKP